MTGKIFNLMLTESCFQTSRSFRTSHFTKIEVHQILYERRPKCGQTKVENYILLDFFSSPVSTFFANTAEIC